jgi:hypothetical protein
MDPTTRPNYSIDALAVELEGQAIWSDPRIISVIQVAIDGHDLRCVKGDCCKDCPGNWYGG